MSNREGSAATLSREELEYAENIDPTRERVAAWRLLNSIHGHTETALASSLSSIGLSLVEFTVMDILQEQVDGHMRMQDVALVAGLTTGATTRLVNRLEGRNLLIRVLCSYDRRGIYTELTPSGVDLLLQAREHHDLAVRETLSNPEMIRAITKLVDAVNAS